jgi:membrane protease YdiL (CAAX protease family)
MLDALRLSVDVFFDSTLWSVVPVVALIAIGAAFVWGDRRLAAFLAALLGLVFVGGAWVTYAFRELPITAEEAVNPIVRYTGALVLLAAVATPLLLASVWRSAAEESR